MSQKFGRNDDCWCGSGLKYKKCHEEIDQRVRALSLEGFEVPRRKLLKTKPQIEAIRESCKLNIAILDYITEFMVEGISTEELDKLIYNKTKELGGIPAPLNYEGFPKSVCISRNEVVCHGIPSDKEFLQSGDIVNVDVSTIYNGYFSDSSRMFLIGEVSEEKKKLVRVAKECMDKGIEAVKPWGFLGDVGQAVNDHAKANGYTVVEDIGGHGVGLEFHEEPWVSYVTKKGTGMVLVPGFIFTIEPMINMGRPGVVLNEEDGWTITTRDGKPSAQWETMILVTETGHEVLCY